MSEDEELITVYSTDQPVQVALAKMRLDGEGIDYIAVNDIISAVYPVDGMAVVRFQVRRSDAERAVELLRHYGHT
ncbi:unnamed protein product [marine sediment metagenome]|uniref:Uncharacterized protein n=1 Tax=marine sediment metagenome TaxID=412755 RepID=X1FUW1_9ZZZZ